MGNVFIISDLHFGHRNMALHRGFKSVEEHDQHIIDCWNSVVTKGDTVWILGDVSMEKATEYHKLGLLKGHKKVVLGNHDMCKPSHNAEMLKYVNCVSGAVTNKSKGYILTHIPIHPNELEYRFKINIHGHVHEKNINDNRYVNVCCEVVNYTPKLLKEVLTNVT